MRDPKTQMFAEACAMLKQAEQLHRQFFGPSSGGQSASWEPPVDVFETEREVTVITALPGVRREAVRAEIEGTTLIVTGVRPIRPQAAVPTSSVSRFPMAALNGASRFPAA